jgi:Rad3-related DNA helicase
MPKIIEEPDLIHCEHAKNKGWPEIFRKGATFCNKCDQVACQFHPKRSYREVKKKEIKLKKAQNHKIIKKKVKPVFREKPSELSVKDVIEQFPSESMRRYQKEIITNIVDAFQTGKRCIILSAPTGFGKSYVNSAFCSVIHSFYTTPQLALIEQILKDPLIGSRFVEIKGRQNYACYHSPNYSVNTGRCITKNYACKERYEVCSYWMQKRRAQNAQSVLTSFAYLIAEGQTEGTSETYLGKRDLLILDESHNIEEQGLNHISVRVNPFTIPYEVYNRILPELNKIKSDSQLKEFLQRLERILRSYITHSQRIIDATGLSIEQVEDMEKIERYLANYNLYELSDSEWVWHLENDQLILQPVFAKEFMNELVWKRADYYIISSATILDHCEFSELNGLKDRIKEDEICFLKVPSTFPIQNRPIIDSVVGPLSSQMWDKNKENALLAIEQILENEDGNVAIHCHSYKNQKWLIDNISEHLRARLIIHSSRDREQKLNEWMNSNGKVFVSVAFNEGQDWKYDICDAQILLKVPFPYLGDKRVRRRLELGYDQWYRNYAMSEVIQAYGRAIRAEDDKARFYIVDGSFLKLINDCWYFMPEWFKEVLPDSFFQRMGLN